MYGLGYGLAKMGEGLSGGALQGRLTTMMLDREKKEKEALEAYRQKTLDQGQQRIDNEQERMEIQRDADAFKIAYDIAKDAPDKQGTFMAIYKNLNPQGDMPEIKFGEKTIDINFEGMKITGSQEQIRQAMEVISKKPEITPQVMQKLAELGLAQITVERPETDKGYGTFSPGAGIFSKDTGKVITPADASKSDSARSDFERAYQQWIAKPENAGKTRADFRNNVWNKSSAAGELSDNSILLNIRELAGYDATKTSVMWDEYLRYRSEGMDRAQALNMIQQSFSESQRKVLDAETAKQILKEAGGDKAKARKLATERGYKF